MTVTFAYTPVGPSKPTHVYFVSVQRCSIPLLVRFPRPDCTIGSFGRYILKPSSG